MPAPQSAFANADPPGEAGSAAGGARADWHGPGTGAGPAQAFALASHSSGALAGAYGGPPPPEAPYASPSKPGGAPGAAERRHSGALPAWQPAAAPAWRPPQPARNLRQYMSAEQAAGSVGHRRAGSWGQGSPAAPGAAQQPGGPALWAQAFDSAAPAPAIAPAPAWPHDAPAWGPQPLGAAPAYAAEPYHDSPRAPWASSLRRPGSRHRRSPPRRPGRTRRRPMLHSSRRRLRRGRRRTRGALATAAPLLAATRPRTGPARGQAARALLRVRSALPMRGRRRARRGPGACAPPWGRGPGRTWGRAAPPRARRGRRTRRCARRPGGRRPRRSPGALAGAWCCCNQAGPRGLVSQAILCVSRAPLHVQDAYNAAVREPLRRGDTATRGIRLFPP